LAYLTEILPEVALEECPSSVICPPSSVIWSLSVVRHLSSVIRPSSSVICHPSSGLSFCPPSSVVWSFLALISGALWLYCSVICHLSSVIWSFVLSSVLRPLSSGFMSSVVRSLSVCHPRQPGDLLNGVNNVPLYCDKSKC
jgi:hypothetical protein